MRSLVLLWLSLLTPESECDLLRDSVHVTSAAARPANELWCYRCLADVPEDRCADLRHNSSSLITKCHNDRRVCMEEARTDYKGTAALPANEVCCYCWLVDMPDDRCAKLRYNNSELITMYHNDLRVDMVKRFSYTTSTENSTTALKMWALERNCTKHCEPGCIIIGERTKLYACTSCCTTSLCNHGSGASRGTLQLKLLSATLLILSTLTRLTL